MQLSNRRFGAATQPFKQSPYSASFELQGNPSPPVECLLGIKVTSGLLALKVGGFLSVHCPGEVYNLVDYLGNTYADYQSNNYIEIQ